MRIFSEFIKGIWKRNPILIIGIGICPTLAVSTSLSNALWMTLAATFVLVCSNVLVSLIKNITPGHIRIHEKITIIATFVIIVELTLKAYQPAVYSALGIFIPLIVVNCIILGRAEEFASKNGVVASCFDGLGMGTRFALTLCPLALIRETIGANKLLGYTLIKGFEPVGVMVMAPGAFFTLGLLLWGMNRIKSGGN